MLGITLDGAAVEVDRGYRSKPHSLSNGTVAEVRSTFIHALLATGRSWAEIAEVMRCDRRTAKTASGVPPLRLHLDGKSHRSPLVGATNREVRAMYVASLRAVGRPWDFIARVMRCSTVTVRRDVSPRVLQPLRREVLANAG